MAGGWRGALEGFDLIEDSFEYWRKLPLPASTSGGHRYRETAGDESSYSNAEKAQRAERYRASVAAVANQRKFFITKKKLIGLGPGALRQDDWVAIVPGSDVPFVLRAVGDKDSAMGRTQFPKDARFQLVGECYVHGIMNGEAVDGMLIDRDIILT